MVVSVWGKRLSLSGRNGYICLGEKAVPVWGKWLYLSGGKCCPCLGEMVVSVWGKRLSLSRGNGYICLGEKAVPVWGKWLYLSWEKAVPVWGKWLYLPGGKGYPCLGEMVVCRVYVRSDRVHLNIMMMYNGSIIINISKATGQVVWNDDYVNQLYVGHSLQQDNQSEDAGCICSPRIGDF